MSPMILQQIECYFLYPHGRRVLQNPMILVSLRLLSETRSILIHTLGRGGGPSKRQKEGSNVIRTRGLEILEKLQSLALPEESN